MKNYLKKAFGAKEISNTILTLLSVFLIIWFGRNVDKILEYNNTKIIELIFLFVLFILIGLFKVKYLDKLNRKNYYFVFNLFLLIFEILFAIYII